MEAAFGLHSGGAGVPVEVGANDCIQLLLFKEPANDSIHRFRHQAFSPIVLGKHKAKGTGSQQIQLWGLLLVIILHAQRPNDLALKVQSEGFLFFDEAVQYLLGLLGILVGQPSRHLAHPIY